MLSSDLEPGFKDMVITCSEIHLSWWDRFKVLFGISIFHECRTQTGNFVGVTKTVSEVSMPRLFSKFFRHYGIVNMGGEQK